MADLSNQIITGLTVTPTSPKAGDVVTVDMTFGESNDQSIIQDGDTISITWPSSGVAYLAAINQSLPVIDPNLDGGTQIGTAVVTNGKATITFNSAVTNQKGITGNFTFRASAANSTTGDAANTTTIAVDAGQKKVSVAITKPKSSSGRGPFSTGDVFFKFASTPTIDSNTNMQTNKWWWEINEWQLNFSKPMVITDQIIAGQKFLPETVKIDIGNGSYTASELATAYPGSSATYDDATKVFTVVLSPSALDGNLGAIFYSTLGTDTTLSQYANTAKVSYYPIGYPSGDKVALNQYSANMIASTEAKSVKSGTCQIKKTLQNSDGDPTSTPLANVTFKLTKQDDPTFTPITATTDAKGTCEFPNLANGTYTATEEDAPAWLIPNPNPVTFTIDDTSTNGVVCIVTNKIISTSVQVNKVWLDGNNTEGQRPNNVSVTLYSDGTSYKGPVSLAEGNKWVYTWDDIPAYTPTGEKIVYSVSEESVEGYQQLTNPAEVVGGSATLTNTKETNIGVSKVWDDKDNQDGIRPVAVIVALQADGKNVAVALPEKNPMDLTGPDWQGSWSNLPGYNKEGKIAYSVVETPITGYTTSYSSIVDENITITNTHIPATTSVGVSKVWDDQDNQDGIRPASVTVTLMANGKATKVEEPNVNPVTVEGTAWTASWTNLPADEAGSAIVYSVEEEKVTGYTTSYSPLTNGTITITNTHIPATTSVGVSKVWDDKENQDGIRPASVTVTLMANGKIAKVEEPNVNPVTVEGTAWTANWTNLPADEAGSAIVYSVEEEKVTGYTTSYSPLTNGTITITNTHTPATTSVGVSKVWDDQDNQDGIRPASVTVTLMANGKVAKVEAPNVNPVKVEGTAWTANGTNLPADEAGSAIVYSVEEEKVTGYTTSYSPITNGTITITNTHIPATTSVGVSKVWDDQDNQDGIRPASVTVTLMANGKAAKVEAPNVNPVTVEGTAWTASWTNLPADEAGSAIVYSVEEEKVKGYTTSYSPITNGTITITNTHIPATTSVGVSKVWDDQDNQDGIRPASVTVTLMANGKIAKVEVPNVNPVKVEGTAWTANWTNLPADEAGSAIVYSVEEEKVTGYTTSYSALTNGNITITNTHMPATTSVGVSKVWNDKDNQDGIRPTSVTVTLMANGKAAKVEAPNVNPVKVEGTAWTANWTNLPADEEGSPIVYSVEEEKVTGYTTSYSPITNGTITITNTHVPATTSVGVSKVWDDQDNQDGIRPASVTVTLMANGKVAKVEAPNVNPVTVEGTAWTANWTNLPADEAGSAIVYSVEEEKVTGYTTSYSPLTNGTITITNTHIPATTSVGVSKVWDDQDNQDGIRPASVTVTLMANGKAAKVEAPNVNPVTVEGTVWTASWTNLPADEAGSTIVYSVEEEKVTGYTTSYSPLTNGTITITNSHTPATTSVGVSKVWDDKNNQDGIRPASVTVTLMANGKIAKVEEPNVNPVTVEGTAWIANWTNLPADEAGSPIVYSVEEEKVKGYTTSYYPLTNGTITITNTHIPATTSVGVSKVWDDKDNQDGIRPTSVTVTLMANGKIAKVEEPNVNPVTVEGTAWTASWTNLPADEAGSTIVYSVEEEKVTGYTASYSPLTNGNITITNSHTPATTSVGVSKVWDDRDNQMCIRPAAITLTLLANGTVVVPVAPDTNPVKVVGPDWKASWHNLPVNVNGKTIVYTVREEAVQGYETSITTVDAYHVVVTNRIKEIQPWCGCYCYWYYDCCTGCWYRCGNPVCNNNWWYYCGYCMANGYGNCCECCMVNRQY